MSAFQVTLHWTELSRVDIQTDRFYDPAVDDVRSILSDACQALNDYGRFHISGFGDASWPLDVATDLCVFVEQLPAAVAAIRQGKVAEIDLYEQGVERRLEITPVDDHCTIECTSSGSWVPDSETERLERDALIGMLTTLLSDFMQALAVVAPALAAHPWILAWCKQRVNFNQARPTDDP